MSKTFYIEDPNGEYHSEDNKRRFKKMNGKEAYKFLSTPSGKGRRFIELNERQGEDKIIKIEVHKDNMKTFRTHERHEQYVADTDDDSQYVSLSLSSIEDETGDEFVEESVPDEDVDSERDALHNYDLERLRIALKTLTLDEMDIIFPLYFIDNPLSERDYATMLGIPQMTLHDRKIKIIEKLKKFF